MTAVKCCEIPQGDEVDLLNCSASDIQQLLGAGKLTSVELVAQCLRQIELHNYNGMELRAVVDAPPLELALQRAKFLDEQRFKGNTNGPLHGIPVLIKDNFSTHPSLGMDTTCGTPALRGAKPKRNAALVDLLLDAGMIVIGKANLSELCLLKATPPNTGGWSAVGGQGISPYVRGGVLPEAKFLGHSTPCGSSSGCAVGVAAGFAPISIGTETDGSIVYPAERAALYALKPTLGTTPLTGSMPISEHFESHGSMAKTVRDLANVTGIIMGGKSFEDNLHGTWASLRIGFLDPGPWLLSENEIEPNDDYLAQTTAARDEAISLIQSHGGKVVYPLRLTTVEDIAAMPNGVDYDSIANDNWRARFDAWLGDFDEAAVRNMDELIQYNKNNADACLPPDHPSQDYLEYHASAEPLPDFEKQCAFLRKTAQEAIKTALAENDIDAILAPGDSRLTAIASAAGYPVGAMPLGFANFNGRAFGVNVLTPAGCEGKMLEVMSAWEATFPQGRKPPPMLVNWTTGNSGTS